MEIKDKILESIAMVLRINTETVANHGADLPLNLIGMDSINCIDIVVAVENEFNINFNDDELLMDNINTVNKLCNSVAQKLGLEQAFAV